MINLLSSALQLVLIEEVLNKPRSEYCGTILVDGVERTLVDVVKPYDYHYLGYVIANLSNGDVLELSFYINGNLVYRDQYKSGEGVIYIRSIDVPRGLRSRITARLVSGTPREVTYRIVVRAL